mgnify:FL=1|jgi:replicative DNA helicase|tara:strand:- start:2919 stop:4271 length:1353 start_codon:yes stop_codon:yes gene_type:complete
MIDTRIPPHNSSDRVLPHNLEAEDGVIASCLDADGSSIYDTVSTIITADDFYSARNRFAFEAMQRLADFGKPLDEIHLCEALKASNTLDEIGGISGLIELMNASTTEPQAIQYANLVQEKSNLRKLIRECRIAQEKATSEGHEFQDIRSSLEGSILEIDSRDSLGFSVKDSVDSIVSDIELMQSGEYKPDVVKTNLNRLDDYLGNGGIAAGEVLTLAAPTSCGKSALALYISARTMIDQGTPTAYFSFEMPQKQLMKRMVQSVSGVNIRSIEQGYAKPKDIEAFNQATEKIKELPLYTSHSVKGVSDLASQARYLVRKKGVKLIVIDYLQLIGFDARLSKAEGIAGISHKIKQIALDLNVSVILLAQVNREGAKRETGLSLYDLKDSGDIENDADVVLLMWPHKGDVESSKDKDHKGSYTGLFYKLAKNREGERDVGSYLKFYNCTGRFE